MYPKLTSVPFCGSNIQVTESNNELYVAMRPICRSIGLNWGSQYNRIMRDDVLSSVSYIMKTTATDGKSYEQVFLPLKYLNGWLFGITTKKVNEDIRYKVLKYKFECYDVLYDYWNNKRVTNAFMNEINELMGFYNNSKDMASICGRGLVTWKKAKSKIESEIQRMIEQSQLKLKV